jgi:hypothetical protein
MEGVSRCSPGRNLRRSGDQLGDRQPGGEDPALQGCHVGFVDQGVINNGYRVLPDELLGRDLRTEVARDGSLNACPPAMSAIVSSSFMASERRSLGCHEPRQSDRDCHWGPRGSRRSSPSALRREGRPTPDHRWSARRRARCPRGPSRCLPREVSPGNLLAVLLLDRPEKAARLVEIAVVGPDLF